MGRKRQSKIENRTLGNPTACFLGSMPESDSTLACSGQAAKAIEGTEPQAQN